MSTYSGKEKEARVRPKWKQFKTAYSIFCTMASVGLKMVDCERTSPRKYWIDYT